MARTESPHLDKPPGYLFCCGWETTLLEVLGLGAIEMARFPADYWRPVRTFGFVVLQKRS